MAADRGLPPPYNADRRNVPHIDGYILEISEGGGRRTAQCTLHSKYLGQTHRVSPKLRTVNIVRKKESGKLDVVDGPISPPKKEVVPTKKARIRLFHSGPLIEDLRELSHAKKLFCFLEQRSFV